MRNIQYSKHTIPIELLEHTANIWVKYIDYITYIPINGVVRKYHTGTILYGDGGTVIWVHGNNDPTGKKYQANTHKPIESMEWTNASQQIYTHLATVARSMQGKIIRIRQRGPDVGHYYCLNSHNTIREYI